MKYPILFVLIFSLAACVNADKENSDGQASEKIELSQKPPVPKSGMLPFQLKDQVRTTLRMELPYTFPEQRGGKQSVLSYSFDVKKNDGRPAWVLKAKLHDAATEKLFAGADYLMLWEVVDPESIQIVNTPDGKMTGISIRPTPGNTFVYHPYTSEPDVAVTEVTIGWYDHVQDRTLMRLYTYMKQLASKMGEWKFDKE